MRHGSSLRAETVVLMSARKQCSRGRPLTGTEARQLKARRPRLQRRGLATRPPSGEPRHGQQCAVSRDADDCQWLLSAVFPVEPDLAQPAIRIAYGGGGKKAGRGG